MMIMSTSELEKQVEGGDQGKQRSRCCSKFNSRHLGNIKRENKLSKPFFLQSCHLSNSRKKRGRATKESFTVLTFSPHLLGFMHKRHFLSTLS